MYIKIDNFCERPSNLRCLHRNRQRANFVPSKYKKTVQYVLYLWGDYEHE